MEMPETEGLKKTTTELPKYARKPTIGKMPEGYYEGKPGTRGKYDPRTGTGRSAPIGSEIEAGRVEMWNKAIETKPTGFFKPEAAAAAETQESSWGGFWDIVSTDWGEATRDGLQWAMDTTGMSDAIEIIQMVGEGAKTAMGLVFGRSRG